MDSRPLPSRRTCPEAPHVAGVVEFALAKILRAELDIGPRPDPERLAACGLIVVNPPWTLEQELKTILPALTAILSPAGGGTSCVDRISNEM